MEFRLTYEGPLYATQRDPIDGQVDRRAGHKHDLRRVFHQQLKRLWKTMPALSSVPLGLRPGGGAAFDITVIGNPPASNIDKLAAEHAIFGFNFVPLVTLDLDLLCGIEVLFLRPDRPGGVVWAGDLDNRLKTLLDALKVPDANERYVDRTPADDETPFFVLLEDDKLISKVSIETDALLEAVGPAVSEADVRLVITVRIKPYEMTPYNMHFG